MAVNKIPIVKELAQKNLVQTKILSGDITSGSDPQISDLDFNNLIIGRLYEVTGNVRFFLDSGSNDDAVELNATHDSAIIDRRQANTGDADSITEVYTQAISFKFKATATSLTFNVVSATANSYIQGDGTRGGTYIQLEERNDLRETT